MKIEDLFDAHNLNHLAAYRHLQNTGQWPKDFIPKETEFSSMWNILILSKLANAWLDYISTFFPGKDDTKPDTHGKGE